jgi:hypothetical protein
LSSGIKIFSLGSEPTKIVAPWGFNNLAGDGISVVPVPLATPGKNYKGVKKP